MINTSNPFPDNEIISFYDCTGMPIFYLHSDGENFYQYDSTPLAYLYNNEFIVSYSGQYLGWLYNGSIIDYKNGAYVFLQFIVLVGHRDQAESLDQVDHQERVDLLN